MRLRVPQHPSHLLVEILAQRASRRLREQFVIGHAAPKKVRQARGQRVVVNRMDRLGIVRLRLQFAAEKEMRRNEDGLQTETDAFLKAIAAQPRLLCQGNDTVLFGPGDWPAVRASGKVR